ncbi:MAG: hypothetical protein WEB33_02045, partial [Bacteroidota bacterium]
MQKLARLIGPNSTSAFLRALRVSALFFKKVNRRDAENVPPKAGGINRESQSDSYEKPHYHHIPKTHRDLTEKELIDLMVLHPDL